MNANQCNVCKKSIARKAQATVACRECNRLFHSGCCQDSWFNTSRQIICPSCWCVVCNSVILRKNQVAIPCSDCYRSFHELCCPTTLFNPERNLHCAYCRVSDSLVTECNVPSLSLSTPCHSDVEVLNRKRDRAALSPPDSHLNPALKRSAAVSISTHSVVNENMEAQLREILERLTTLQADMTGLRGETSALRTDLNKLRRDVTRRVSTLEKSIVDVHATVSNITKQQTLVDTHEALFSGIPTNVTSQPFDIINSILTAMKVPHLAKFIINIRDWTAKSSNSQLGQSSMDVASNSTSGEALPSASQLLDSRFIAASRSFPTKAYAVKFHRWQYVSRWWGIVAFSRS